jgi:hypothetical protein
MGKFFSYQCRDKQLQQVAFGLIHKQHKTVLVTKTAPNLSCACKLQWPKQHSKLKTLAILWFTSSHFVISQPSSQFSQV